MRKRILSIKLGSKKQPVRKGEEGWTFIETIIVLAIVLTLSTSVGFLGFRFVGQAKTAAARNQIETISLALSGYLFDCGRYPTEAQGLAALWSQPTAAPVPDNWSGPYIEKKIESDPWGNPYRYTVPGPNGLPYGIASYGADGREGGEGDARDVLSWEQ